jgi:uncharacterized protein (DUF488 family)
VEIYTIGFTRRSAADFFGTLRDQDIRRLVDVRLHNVSQLAGFAKRDDLAYFLRELCGADYAPEPLLAPEAEMLDTYRSRQMSWEAYAQAFMSLMTRRQIESAVNVESWRTVPTVLLCSEPTAERCHRRLIVEYLRTHGWPELQATHL